MNKPIKGIVMAGIALCVAMGVSSADTITFSGQITQSILDGTGPAVNNQALNSIRDGDGYTVTINFAGHIVSPGTYDLTGGTLNFFDNAGGQTETAFGAISLTVATDASSSTSVCGVVS